MKHHLFKKNTTLQEQIDKAYRTYYNHPIDQNLVFVESRDAKDFTGNIFRIVEELGKPSYHHLQICVFCKKEVEHRIRRLSSRYNFPMHRIFFTNTVWDSVEVMERAKYIVSDSGIPWEYVKREGQIVLNTWHGTPLKVMGRHIPTEKHIIGTVQHFFLSSDYFVYPSHYMKDTMLRSYMMDNIASGKALMTGYPRNSVFLDKDRASTVRKELGWGQKKVFVYMPTHRGNHEKNKNSSQLGDVIDFMTELDLHLTENELVLVKLHVFNQSKIEFAQFEHIRAFPNDYEAYDVLNAADALITDYSSVLFDYANTRKKIILFAYDKEEYFEDRGLYFPLEELPFPMVENPTELLTEMRRPIAYDDRAFLEKFCTFDSLDATEKLCQHVFLKNNQCKEETLGNGKENVLIFGGALTKNGITSALLNLLKSLDHTKRNYYYCFRRIDINKDPDRLNAFSDNLDYLPLMNDQIYMSDEKKAYDWYRAQTDHDTPYPEELQRLFKREWDRYFWGANFCHVIQFDGYGKNVNLLFAEAPFPKTVYVHNDMLKELQTKTVQHGPTLRKIYSEFDNVAIVTPDIRPMTEAVSHRTDNICVVNNIHNHIDVRQRATFPIELDKDTLLQCWNPDGLHAFLKDDGFRFVAVGRFSWEKGHQRLIDAFETFSESYPSSKLLIIGGHGNLYTKTVNHALSKNCWRSIFFIRSISNPMPIVKRCDLMIQSSFHEGLPLVLQEADCLGIPCISTDIPGPRSFFTQYGGHLVDDSTGGILQGMYDFANGKVSAMNVDYEIRNQQSVQEFEALFKECHHG